jgi:serine protease
MSKFGTHSRKLALFCVLTASLALVPALDGIAGTLQVDGSLATPGAYANIQLALNAASNGDTILVHPGLYTQNLNFGNKQVALHSTNGPSTTTVSVNGGVGVVIGGLSELVGFTIKGAVSDFGAGVVVNGAGTLIKGNIFDGNQQTAGGYGAAIGGNSASPIIDGNIFRNNSSDSQFLSGVVSFINSSSPLIVNNLFEGNVSRAINLTLPTGNNPRVVNNTFVNNSVAIRVDRRINTSSFELRNNIIVNNGIGFEVDFGSDGQNPTWTNNLVFGNATDYDVITNQTGINGNISVNPMFAGSTDLHLLVGSPAIDTGTSLDAPNHDFDGNSRPFGGGYDLGAFEAVPEPHALGLACAGLVATLLLINGKNRRRQAGE